VIIWSPQNHISGKKDDYDGENCLDFRSRSWVDPHYERAREKVSKAWTRPELLMYPAVVDKTTNRTEGRDLDATRVIHAAHSNSIKPSTSTRDVLRRVFKMNGFSNGLNPR
jgi:hypothetical protein